MIEQRVEVACPVALDRFVRQRPLDRRGSQLIRSVATPAGARCTRPAGLGNDRSLPSPAVRCAGRPPQDLWQASRTRQFEKRGPWCARGSLPGDAAGRRRGGGWRHYERSVRKEVNGHHRMDCRDLQASSLSEPSGSRLQQAVTRRSLPSSCTLEQQVVGSHGGHQQGAYMAWVSDPSQVHMGLQRAGLRLVGRQ